jgi:hypothetical protein
MISFDGETESCIKQYLNNDKRNRDSLFSFDIKKNIIINSPFIKVNTVYVNGEKPATIILPNEDYKLSIEIEGTIDIPFNFETIIQLIRSDNTIVGTFVSTHINGISHHCKEGHFHINESIIIPNSLTNSEYHIALQLALQNQMYLVEIHQLVKLIKRSNISLHTGVSFDDQYGYFILSTN